MAKNNVVRVSEQHRALAQESDGGGAIATGHARGGMVHADLPNRPLKIDDARAVGTLLRTLADEAKKQRDEMDKEKPKPKKGGSNSA